MRCQNKIYSCHFCLDITSWHNVSVLLLSVSTTAQEEPIRHYLFLSFTVCAPVHLLSFSVHGTAEDDSFNNNFKFIGNPFIIVLR